MSLPLDPGVFFLEEVDNRVEGALITGVLSVLEDKLEDVSFVLELEEELLEFVLEEDCLEDEIEAGTVGLELEDEPLPALSGNLLSRNGTSSSSSSVSKRVSASSLFPGLSSGGVFSITILERFDLVRSGDCGGDDDEFLVLLDIIINFVFQEKVNRIFFQIY
jgi:hypothetical protein